MEVDQFYMNREILLQEKIFSLGKIFSKKNFDGFCG
jgi:hypothetical protein